MTVSAATMTPESCERRAGGAVHGGLGEAAVHDHPARKPGGEVGGAEADQLSVGIDRVVRPAGVALGRAQPFSEADEHDPSRGRDRLEIVGQREAIGRSERRQPAVDLTDDRDALGGEVEHRHDDDPEQHRDERAGHDRHEPSQHDHDRQR